MRVSKTPAFNGSSSPQLAAALGECNLSSALWLGRRSHRWIACLLPGSSFSCRTSLNYLIGLVNSWSLLCLISTIVFVRGELLPFIFRPAFLRLLTRLRLGIDLRQAARLPVVFDTIPLIKVSLRLPGCVFVSFPFDVVLHPLPRFLPVVENFFHFVRLS